jgi:PleD family two-component response regulator
MGGTHRESYKMALQALQNGVQDYLVEGQGDGDLISRAIRHVIERIRAEERLAYISRYAHLTGLANRVRFQDRPCRALVRPTATGRW